MMPVMEIGAGPIREEVVQAEREIVAGMRIDSLEEPEDNPGIHRQDVEIAGKCTPY